jgi:hypothetical protein
MSDYGSIQSFRRYRRLFILSFLALLFVSFVSVRQARIVSLQREVIAAQKKVISILLTLDQETKPLPAQPMLRPQLKDGFTW